MQDEQTVENDAGTRRNFVIRSGQAILGISLASFIGSLKLFGQNKGPAQKKSSIASVQSTAPFLGEIQITSANFAPKGWAFCNGQILAISTNTALFSLLGTTYGGNGTTTFALPNLQARVPICVSSIDPSYYLGATGGESAHTLVLNELPLHMHSLSASPVTGLSPNPSGTYPAQNNQGLRQYSSSTNTSLNDAAVNSTGSGQPHENMSPYLTLNFIIAMVGVYPTR